MLLFGGAPAALNVATTALMQSFLGNAAAQREQHWYNLFSFVWDKTTNHFDRTVMHCAIESGNNTIVRVLLAAGVNPNVIEGCGISLLHLAALGKSILTWLTGLR